METGAMRRAAMSRRPRGFLPRPLIRGADRSCLDLNLGPPSALEEKVPDGQMRGDVVPFDRASVILLTLILSLRGEGTRVAHASPA